MSQPTPTSPKPIARAYTHPGLPEPADKDYAVIGKSKPKIDAREKVTGQARYTADLKFPNMLYGKILTSPHAHARILSIDTSEAEKIPGVKAVITHKDVPTLKYGISPARWDENIFCIDLKIVPSQSRFDGNFPNADGAEHDVIIRVLDSGAQRVAKSLRCPKCP